MKRAREFAASWGVLADGVVDHPKFVALATTSGLKPMEALAAVGLWTKANGYIARHMTDGFVPCHLVPLLAGLPASTAHRLAAALVAVRGPQSTHGLWEEAEGGYLVHDYTVWNSSREERTEVRRRKQEAGRRGGQRSAQARGRAAAAPPADAAAAPVAKASAQASTVQKNYPPTPLQAGASSNNGSDPLASVHRQVTYGRARNDLETSERGIPIAPDAEAALCPQQPHTPEGWVVLLSDPKDRPGHQHMSAVLTGARWRPEEA